MARRVIFPQVRQLRLVHLVPSRFDQDEVCRLLNLSWLVQLELVHAVEWEHGEVAAGGVHRRGLSLAFRHRKPFCLLVLKECLLLGAVVLQQTTVSLIELRGQRKRGVETGLARCLFYGRHRQRRAFERVSAFHFGLLLGEHHRHLCTILPIDGGAIRRQPSILKNKTVIAIFETFR